MLERTWRKWNIPPLLEGMQTRKPLWKSVWPFFRKMGISLPQDPAIPFLGIYPKEAHSYNKDICSTMFITALLVIAITRNNLGSPHRKNR